MNSALQCLSATVPFARFLKSGAYKAELNRHNVMGSRGYLARAIAKLLSGQFHTESPEHDLTLTADAVMWSQEHSRVSPDAVKEAISRFAPVRPCSVVCDSGLISCQQFEGFEQQDAQVSLCPLAVTTSVADAHICLRSFSAFCWIVYTKI